MYNQVLKIWVSNIDNFVKLWKLLEDLGLLPLKLLSAAPNLTMYISKPALQDFMIAVAAMKGPIVMLCLTAMPFSIKHILTLLVVLCCPDSFHSLFFILINYNVI